MSAGEGGGTAEAISSVRRARDRRDMTVRSLVRVGPRSVGGVLQGTQRDAQKWGVGNLDKLAWLEVRDTC